MASISCPPTFRGCGDASNDDKSLGLNHYKDLPPTPLSPSPPTLPPKRPFASHRPTIGNATKASSLLSPLNSSDLSWVYTYILAHRIPSTMALATTPSRPSRPRTNWHHPSCLHPPRPFARLVLRLTQDPCFCSPAHSTPRTTNPSLAPPHQPD
jgi:hypothetical protein